jgi:hypothetical protein
MTDFDIAKPVIVPLYYREIIIDFLFILKQGPLIDHPISLIAYCGFVLVATFSIIYALFSFLNWSLTALGWSVIPN